MLILQGAFDTYLTNKCPLCILPQGSDSDEVLSICTRGFKETEESSKLNQQKVLPVVSKEACEESVLVLL